MAEPIALLRGSLDALVLKALTWGPMHGYEITAWLDDRAAGTLEVLDSALYQALYRLEARRLIAAVSYDRCRRRPLRSQLRAGSNAGRCRGASRSVGTASPHHSKRISP